jgi:hypothetical protein
MTLVARILMRGLVAAAAGFFGLFWSGDIPLNQQSALVSSADARVGRPMTPMSYAGVARRTTRRAVAVGAAAGAAYGTGCVQVVDSYGRVSTVCR